MVRRKLKKHAGRYFFFLNGEGYHPWFDDNSDVAFKYEGGHYLIEIDEEDETFFRLVYPNFWRIESDRELARVKDAALAVTAECKFVKIFLEGDTNTSAAIELFCGSPHSYEAVFDRCLNSLQAAVMVFVARMKGLPKETDDFVFHLPKYNLGAN